LRARTLLQVISHGDASEINAVWSRRGSLVANHEYEYRPVVVSWLWPGGNAAGIAPDARTPSDPCHAAPGLTPYGLRRTRPPWLLVEWPPDSDEPTDYWLSNMDDDTPLAELVPLAKSAGGSNTTTANSKPGSELDALRSSMAALWTGCCLVAVGS
jgi:hypothetical protein